MFQGILEMEALIEEVKKMVAYKIGVNLQILRKGIWEKAIQERMDKVEISEEEAYLRHLVLSAEELQELIELLVVPETWFFREKGSFHFLVEHVKHLMKDPKNGVIRILSMPCSSGEEPYSTVIALLEAEVDPNSFTVDAVDISHKLLAKADLGLYGNNAFRGSSDAPFKQRFFEKTEEGYVIAPSIRKQVNFSQGNALVSFGEKEAPFYHIIFCRNLFIYLDNTIRKKVFHLLDRSLLPGGVLMVAPVETEVVRKFGYIRAEHPKSFAYYKKRESLGNDREGVWSPKDMEMLNTALKDKLAKERQSIEKQKKDAPPSYVVTEEVGQQRLKKVKEAADSGQFDQAQTLCSEYLQEFGPHANAYFLLGLIHHAKREENAAERAFQRAVYLDPNYHEALVYLTLLAERKGDARQASLFRDRAEKSLKNKSG